MKVNLESDAAVAAGEEDGNNPREQPPRASRDVRQPASGEVHAPWVSSGRTHRSCAREQPPRAARDVRELGH